MKHGGVKREFEKYGGGWCWGLIKEQEYVVLDKCRGDIRTKELQDLRRLQHRLKEEGMS
jgi:hypothetical protein